MTFFTEHLYLICFLGAALLSAVLTPVMRLIAIRFNVFDHPITDIKTHRTPVPYLGGVAIALTIAIALIFIRFATDFPTGTLHTLRGILMGGLIVVFLGLIDDIKHKGLRYQTKFVIQILAGLCVMSFGIRIDFIHPAWLADCLTLLWIVGIMNAVNIIDIMDGLASGVGMIASFGFLFISMPSEQIYVNFLAAASAGALLGFVPYNLSQKQKIFMGDAGSLLVGFLLATQALGTSYTRISDAAVLAPILILAIPIYDTVLVSILRLKRGMSPFLGSKDHFALRMEKMGLNRRQIIGVVYGIGILLVMTAYVTLHVNALYAAIIYTAVSLAAILSAWRLSRIPMNA